MDNDQNYYLALYVQDLLLDELIKKIGNLGRAAVITGRKQPAIYSYGSGMNIMSVSMFFELSSLAGVDPCRLLDRKEICRSDRSVCPDMRHFVAYADNGRQNRPAAMPEWLCVLRCHMRRGGQKGMTLRKLFDCADYFGVDPSRLVVPPQTEGNVVSGSI